MEEDHTRAMCRVLVVQSATRLECYTASTLHMTYSLPTARSLDRAAVRVCRTAQRHGTRPAVRAGVLHTIYHTPAATTHDSLQPPPHTAAASTTCVAASIAYGRRRATTPSSPLPAWAPRYRPPLLRPSGSWSPRHATQASNPGLADRVEAGLYTHTIGPPSPSTDHRQRRLTLP